MDSNFTYWHAVLTHVRDSIRESSPTASAQEQLNKKVCAISHTPLTTLRTTDTVTKAQSTFAEIDSDFVLVSASSETLDGILQRQLLSQALKQSTVKTVAQCMERNVCVEPETATVLEVLDRMTIGFCRCTVVVDHHSGSPMSIISPQELYEFLSSFFELPSVEELLKHELPEEGKVIGTPQDVTYVGDEAH
jgi:signal-transduction protein with cAMP-binding, CBS, and nucleotidyltransferase domain